MATSIELLDSPEPSGLQLIRRTTPSLTATERPLAYLGVAGDREIVRRSKVMPPHERVAAPLLWGSRLTGKLRRPGAQQSPPACDALMFRTSYLFSIPPFAVQKVR
jgi:hypothetical protein